MFVHDSIELGLILHDGTTRNKHRVCNFALEIPYCPNSHLINTQGIFVIRITSSSYCTVGSGGLLTVQGYNEGQPHNTIRRYTRELGQILFLRVYAIEFWTYILDSDVFLL